MNQPDDTRRRITREQADMLAQEYQDKVMKTLFGFLANNGPTTSISPTTNTNNHEEETDSRLN